MGLLAIPGTTVGSAQAGYSSAQIFNSTHYVAGISRDCAGKTRKNGNLVLPHTRRCIAWSEPMDKLTEIMAHKRSEIAPLIRAVPVAELRDLNAMLPRPPSFLQALKRPDGQLAVIAEIKRRSPSAGAIKENASALDQALRYRSAGASALSILTDQ